MHTSYRERQRHPKRGPTIRAESPDRLSEEHWLGVDLRVHCWASLIRIEEISRLAYRLAKNLDDPYLTATAST